MISFIGFIIVLIPLVVIHEFGHFLFAKLFNVRADAFSIGFGPVIFAKKLGETDFRISMIPLGGYVKLLGENPLTELSPDEKPRALHHQSPWKRFFIFLGGPLCNFIWAIIIFTGLLALGEPHASSKIGRVLPDSSAAKMGLLSGDKIISVNHETISKYDELNQKLAERGNQDVLLEVERDGNIKEFTVKTDTEDGFSIYGEPKQIGVIKGIYSNPRNTKIGVSDPESPAGRAGLQTGDEIVSINGTMIQNYEQLESEYAKLGFNLNPNTLGPVSFKVKNHSDEKIITLTYSKNYSGNLSTDFGVYSAELFVEKTIDHSPAAVAGIQMGDRLIGVNNVPSNSFYQFRMDIQKSGENQQKVEILVERQGKKLNFNINPQVSTERDPVLNKIKQFTIGVIPIKTLGEPEWIREQFSSPLKLVSQGTLRMLELTEKNFISLFKIFFGNASVNSLGGPVLIAKIAGDSIHRGIFDFLKTMGILSIGLGVLNILPIPVLDGGHIALLGLEVVRGKSLSLKQLKVAQMIGLFLILCLIFIVIRNDVLRLSVLKH